MLRSLESKCSRSTPSAPVAMSRTSRRRPRLTPVAMVRRLLSSMASSVMEMATSLSRPSPLKPPAALSWSLRESLPSRISLSSSVTSASPLSSPEMILGSSFLCSQVSVSKVSAVFRLMVASASTSEGSSPAPPFPSMLALVAISDSASQLVLSFSSTPPGRTSSLEWPPFLQASFSRFRGVLSSLELPLRRDRSHSSSGQMASSSFSMSASISRVFWPSPLRAELPFMLISLQVKMVSRLC